MNNRRLNFFSAALMVLLLAASVSFGAEPIIVDQTVTRQEVVKDYVRTVDNFIILFDSSSSMADPYKDTGLTRLAAAKKILKDRIQLLPDLEWNAGLYLYTPFTELYPVQKFDREKYLAALDQIPEKAAEATPLFKAMEQLEKILAKLSGSTAVFLFTDGSYSTMPGMAKTPIDLAKGMVAKHDVCFYLISGADDKAGMQFVNQFAQVNYCSNVAPFEALYGGIGYLYGAIMVVDQRTVDKFETVQKIAGYKLGQLEFDFNSDKIKVKNPAEAEKLGKFLEQNPEAYLLIAGYTDSVGTFEYNMQLSRKRAESAANYMMTNFKLQPGQIVTTWYGPRDPVADNATAEGRALNRRIEGILLGTDQYK
jgi:OOP family OmpA-OmpF porin